MLSCLSRPWVRRVLGYDTETTGVDDNSRIVEFGAVLAVDGAVEKAWRVLLCPPNVDWQSPTVVEAMNINEITFSELRGKPTFSEAFPLIRTALIQAPVRVGHNVVFDSRMMRGEFRRSLALGELNQDDIAGMSSIVTLDTMALDLYLHPKAGRYNLKAVGARWGVKTWVEHSAVGDADASIRILTAMSEHLPECVFETENISRMYQQRWQDKFRNWSTGRVSDDERRLVE